MASFDPLRALRTLDRHGVRFVLIGGLAARLHGSPSLTFDLDICYSRDQKNLVALSAALVELGARLRGVRDQPSVRFRLDARTLAAGDTFTFDTDAGPVDILGTPSGTGGFSELEATATEMDLGGVSVRVAALELLMRMKSAAGRPKDRIELEILEALKDEIEHGQRPERGR